MSEEGVLITPTLVGQISIIASKLALILWNGNRHIFQGFQFDSCGVQFPKKHGLYKCIDIL